MSAGTALLAGIGNSFRHDDGAGPAVVAKAMELAAGTPLARCLVDAGPLGAPFDLVDLLVNWEGAVVVADAVSSGAGPGTLTIDHLEPGTRTLGFSAGRQRRPSTHGIGIFDLYRTLCQLGLAPRRLAVIGIEGADFSQGAGLSATVGAAITEAAALALDVAAGQLRSGEH
ncbi:MAG TPA: hydrogenase maturation protease [Acidimicrobiales bacterium]|nr:hydrogenase maturation protease [Acidimicrobiales bacterium]